MVKIGITLNNLLRNHIDKVREIYVAMEMGTPIEPINPYDLEPSFPIIKKNVDDLDNIYQYMFYEWHLEVFGAANETLQGTLKNLSTLNDNNIIEISLISIETNASIAATLFFLSKNNTTIRKIYFPKTYEECWDNIDILITDNPHIINVKPTNKECILVKNDFNEAINVNGVINDPSEIIDFIKENFLKNSDEK